MLARQAFIMSQLQANPPDGHRLNERSIHPKLWTYPPFDWASRADLNPGSFVICNQPNWSKQLMYGARREPAVALPERTPSPKQILTHLGQGLHRIVASNSSR